MHLMCACAACLSIALIKWVLLCKMSTFLVQFSYFKGSISLENEMMQWMLRINNYFHEISFFHKLQTSYMNCSMDYKALLRIFQVEFRTIFTKERILAPSGLIFAPARVLWFHHLDFSTKTLGYFYEMLSFRVQFSRSLMVIGRRVRVKLFPIYDVAVKFSLGNYFSSNNGSLRFTCQILRQYWRVGIHIQ